MYGDFSRDSYQAHAHARRVLLQQGRVLLDADWNEQTAILLHYLESLASDLLGPHAGPGDSFAISPVLDGSDVIDLTIAAGRYYVDGVLCENDPVDGDGTPLPSILYSAQPDYPLSESQRETMLPKFPFLIYLDVWERSISAIEDPTIREVALGGPDTAARARTVWQVKVMQTPTGLTLPAAGQSFDDATWKEWINVWQGANRGELKAGTKENATREGDPCIIPPDARYRGPENQLYRVEVHTGGPAGGASRPPGRLVGAGDVLIRSASGGSTFKMSRDNGSVVFPIRTLGSSKGTWSVELETWGRDGHPSLTVDDWVEVVDDDTILRTGAGQLAQVAAISLATLMVTLQPAQADASVPTYSENDLRHPLLRRWDHRQGASNRGGLTIATDGGARIVEGRGDQAWLTLEDGVQIQFQPGAIYRTGDYWLIPARTATGDVLWPVQAGRPLGQSPHGVEHHYAPLAVGHDVNTFTDQRRPMRPSGVD